MKWPFVRRRELEQLHSKLDSLKKEISEYQVSSKKQKDEIDRLKKLKKNLESKIKELSYSFRKDPSFLTPFRLDNVMVPSIPASYVIFKKGAYYFAQPCRHGLERLFGSNASSVIQSAINSLSNGGKIFIKGGIYRLSETLTIPNSLSEKIILQGEGTERTRLQQTSSGENIITVGYNSFFDIMDMSLFLPSTGSTGHGIESGKSGEYGWKYSRIERVEIWNGDSTHWAVKLINPTFLSIRSLKIRNAVNGMSLIADHATLNFGHSWFSDVFIAPAGAVGILLKIDSVSRRMNQLTFSRLHLIPDSYVTGSKGIEIGESGPADSNWFFGVTAENLDYAVDVINGSYNSFEGMYIRAKGETSAVLRARSGSRATSFRDIDVIQLERNVGTALRDENTWKGAPTLFDHIRLGVFATYFVTTVATKLRMVSISETGELTENSGTAIIAAGETYVDVSHGLSMIPTLERIGLTPQTDLEGRDIWVSNATRTTFRINISSVDTKDNVIGWRYG